MDGPNPTLEIRPPDRREMLAIFIRDSAVKLFGQTGFNDWIANCKGLACLSDLVEEVRGLVRTDGAAI